MLTQSIVLRKGFLIQAAVLVIHNNLNTIACWFEAKRASIAIGRRWGRCYLQHQSRIPLVDDQRIVAGMCYLQHQSRFLLAERRTNVSSFAPSCAVIGGAAWKV